MVYPNTQLLIANRWIDSDSRKTLGVLNPATGTVIDRVAQGDVCTAADPESKASHLRKLGSK